MEISKDKYIFFSVDSENYGINIKTVKEIIRFEGITFIQDSQKYMKGVINLRGKIVPIVDMRIKFQLPERKYNDRTVFIIVEINDYSGEYLIGIAVDAVFDIHDVTQEETQPPPKTGLNNKNEFVKGMIKFNEDIALILDINCLLTTNEITPLTSEDFLIPNT